MKYLSQKNLIIVLIVLVAVLLSLLIIFWNRFGGGEERYAVVFMDPGIIYFGKLSRFPSPRLSDVWTIQQQQGQGNEQGGSKLVPLSELPWASKEPLRLNKDKIVSWTYLDETSQVFQEIKSSKARPPAGFMPQGGLQEGIQGTTPSIQGSKSPQQPPGLPLPTPKSPQ